VISTLLPDDVVVCAATEDDPSAELAPAEEPAVARAVASRRAEFTTGRTCARTALQRLGAPTDAVPVGEKRAPVWPDGVVGSITHCRGYRAAAVAWASRVRSVGVDAEVDGPLPDGVLDAVSDAGERAELADLPPGVHWDRVLFSAKESVYKTWFPLTGRWLGFEQAGVTPAPDGTFTAVLRVPGPEVDGVVIDRFHGRWAVGDGLVFTAIALPAR
jgi:4'-phosphopantetheinyl transferase EntD